MELGVNSVGEEELLDFTEDPWQGFSIFSAPELTAVSSPATVQDKLEQLPAKNEARVCGNYAVLRGN